MMLLKLYWKQIAVIALGLIIYASGYLSGRNAIKRDYDAYRAIVEANGKAAEIHAKEVEKQREEVTTNVVKGYADAVSKINDYYKSHPRIVRLCDSTGSSVSGSSESATGTSEGLGRTEQTVTEVDLNKAGAEVMQCRKLIEWVKLQGVVK